MRLLSTELAKDKNNKVYIFTGNIRNKPKLEKFSRTTIVRFAQIHAFTPFYKAVPFFKAVFTHVFASVESYNRYCKGLKLDVVHGFSSSPMLALRTLVFRYYSKNSVFVHTIKSISAFKALGFISTILLNKMDAVIVLNNLAKERLVSSGVSADRISVIESPIDLKKFVPITNKKSLSSLKERYGFRGKKVILYYGHFNKFKGVEFLIRSLRHIKSQDITLILIPSFDSNRDYYDKIIHEEGAEGIVSVVSSDVNLVDYIHLADVVVLPYPSMVSTEANPSCLLEAMACGKPVVTTDLAELHGIAKHGFNALLAKPKDHLSIAQNIDLVLSDAGLRKEISAKAVSAAGRFDSKRICYEHMRLYSNLRRYSRLQK